MCVLSLYIYIYFYIYYNKIIEKTFLLQKIYQF